MNLERSIAARERSCPLDCDAQERAQERAQEWIDAAPAAADWADLRQPGRRSACSRIGRARPAALLEAGPPAQHRFKVRAPLEQHIGVAQLVAGNPDFTRTRRGS